MIDDENMASVKNTLYRATMGGRMLDIAGCSKGEMMDLCAAGEAAKQRQSLTVKVLVQRGILLSTRADCRCLSSGVGREREVNVGRGMCCKGVVLVLSPGGIGCDS